MKRKASLQIYERLKNLNFQEKVEYWKKRNEIFMREQEVLQRNNPSKTTL